MSDIVVQPDNIALIVVDSTPMWMFSHTCLEQQPDQEQRAEAVVTQRISDLMALFHDRSGGDTNWPFPIAVESRALEHVRLVGLKGRVLGLVGVYGDLCVLDVAQALRRRGWPVVIIEDACLWTAPLVELLDPQYETYKASLAQFPRVRAADLWPKTTVSQFWKHEPPAYHGPDHDYSEEPDVQNINR